MPTPNNAPVTRPGKGHVLMVGPYTTATTTYVAVSPVVSIDGPSEEMGTREVTHLQSFAREFEPTILDGGTITIKVWDDPTNTGQQLISNAIHTTGVPTNMFWKLVFPTTTNFLGFFGPATQWALSGLEVDGTATRTLGIKVSGMLTLPTTT